ncbi:MAG: hypothetical protein HFI44_05985 [Lachnospiraceae bacterium]|nr:hypothetical protein [Lachnospiraceae bacterium]GFI02220.1 hypothetical protein IMSAGC005_01048 [Lachnospiraceae bacterium]
MQKKFLIVGAILVVIVVGIFVGKVFIDKQGDSPLPAEEIIIIDSEEADTTVDHMYYEN